MKKTTGNFLISCAIGGIAFLLYTVRDIVSAGDDDRLYIESGDEIYSHDDKEEEDKSYDYENVIEIDDSDIEF